MFCKYKDILGSPGLGLHKYRIHNIAIVDVILTIIVAYFLSNYFNSNFLTTLFLLFILGIILHRLFCVKTTVDKFLFGNS